MGHLYYRSDISTTCNHADWSLEHLNRWKVDQVGLRLASPKNHHSLRASHAILCRSAQEFEDQHIDEESSTGFGSLRQRSLALRLSDLGLALAVGR